MAGVFGLRLEIDVPPEFKAKDILTVDMNAAVNPGDWAVVPRVRRGGHIDYEIKQLAQPQGVKRKWRITWRNRAV